jgi:hypothetical protein
VVETLKTSTIEHLLKDSFQRLAAFDKKLPVKFPVSIAWYCKEAIV